QLPLCSIGSLLQPEGGFWDYPWFEREAWKDAMFGLRVILSLGGALALIAMARAKPLHALPRERTLRRLGILVTAIAFLSYFDFFNPNVRYAEYYHRHEFFHY